MARINMDVDGPAADFVGHLFSLLREEGFDLKPASDPMWRSWDVFGPMGEEARKVAFQMLAESEFWLTLPVTVGSQEAIRAFRAADHHIQWVTTGWPKCETWWGARMTWLDQHFADSAQNLDDDLSVTGSKTQIWADAFVDDKAVAVNAWQRRWPASKSYMFETNHNYASHGKLVGIDGWSQEAVKKILFDLAKETT